MSVRKRYITGCADEPRRRIRLKRQPETRYAPARKRHRNGVPETGLIQFQFQSNQFIPATGSEQAADQGEDEAATDSGFEPTEEMKAKGVALRLHLTVTERVRLNALLDSAKAERETALWDENAGWSEETMERAFAELGGNKHERKWSRIIWTSTDSVGNFLRYQRYLDSFKIEEMARYAGVDVDTWRAWEDGREVPTRAEVVELAARIYPKASQREQLLLIREAMAA